MMGVNAAAITALVQHRRRLLAGADELAERIEQTAGRLRADQQREREIRDAAASIGHTLESLGATRDELDYSSSTTPKPLEMS